MCKEYFISFLLVESKVVSDLFNELKTCGHEIGKYTMLEGIHSGVKRKPNWNAVFVLVFDHSSNIVLNDAAINIENIGQNSTAVYQT